MVLTTLSSHLHSHPHHLTVSQPGPPSTLTLTLRAPSSLLTSLDVTHVPQWSNLTHIYLSCNRLETLPPLPPNLQVLSLADNFLTALPPLPTSIKNVNLTNNPITRSCTCPHGLCDVYYGTATVLNHVASTYPNVHHVNNVAITDSVRTAAVLAGVLPGLRREVEKREDERGRLRMRERGRGIGEELEGLGGFGFGGGVGNGGDDDDASAGSDLTISSTSSNLPPPSLSLYPPPPLNLPSLKPLLLRAYLSLPPPFSTLASIQSTAALAAAIVLRPFEEEVRRARREVLGEGVEVSLRERDGGGGREGETERRGQERGGGRVGTCSRSSL